MGGVNNAARGEASTNFIVRDEVHRCRHQKSVAARRLRHRGWDSERNGFRRLHHRHCRDSHPTVRALNTAASQSAVSCRAPDESTRARCPEEPATAAASCPFRAASPDPNSATVPNPRNYFAPASASFSASRSRDLAWESSSHAESDRGTLAPLSDHSNCAAPNPKAG